MEFFENRSKRPFIAFVWIAKTLRNWYRINRTRRILSQMRDEQLMWVYPAMIFKP